MVKGTANDNTLDPVVAQRDYDWLENALTEKYGEAESASASLSRYFSEMLQFSSEMGLKLDKITHRVLVQEEGVIVIEHFLATPDAYSEESANLVGYYYLDQTAYNDYLYQQTENDIRDYLLEQL